MNKTIIIAGGDRRFAAAARYFSDKNSNVIRIYDGTTNSADGITADVLILPVPVSKNGKYLFAPGSTDNIPLEKLATLINKGGTVFGGKADQNIVKMFTDSGANFIDYNSDEEFTIKNAMLTAEGAVMTAISLTDTALFRQNILIIGFGRIGKSLARILGGFGADVTAAARRSESRAWAEIYGCKSVSINGMKNRCGKYSIIFNTVPSLVIDEDMISNLDKNTLIIDLASAPGGTDFAAAKKAGLNTLHYTGVPGKVSPVTAGTIAAQTVERLLDTVKREE